MLFGPLALLDWDAAATAAVVAAIVGGLAGLGTAVFTEWYRARGERELVGHRLREEHRSDQQRELRALIAQYHGRLVESAAYFHYRLMNLYRNETAGWLDKPSGYYFETTGFRFLTVCSVARAFERKAYFIDARYAEPKDFDFLKYSKAFLWVTTDVALFKGLDEYGIDYATDHFFSDQLREICDSFCPSSDECLSLSEFRRRSGDDGEFHDVGEFFLGLRSSENRLRWDRIVAFHLLILAFLGSFGYEDLHRPGEDFMRDVAEKLRHDEIRTNLVDWLPKLGLAEEPSATMLKRVLERRGSRNDEKPSATAS